MAYTPISGAVPQFQRNAGGAAANGYYLKGYSAGTTTPLSMGTDSTPTATLAKCALNSRGEPISNDADETTVFIPHFNASYKLVLYTNATDADNNTTANAVWVVDNISGQFDSSQLNFRSGTTVADFLENLHVADYTALRGLTSSELQDGDVITVTNDGIAGPGVIKTGTVTDNGGTRIVFTDDSNRYWERVYKGAVFIEWFGGISGSSTANATTNATALSNAIDYITSTATGGEIDFGDNEWVVGAITISYTDRYLVLKGNQTKLRTTGAWTIQDGGFLHICGFEAQPTVAKAHDFLTFSASVDRNARFIVGDCNIGNFDNGIHFTGAASQAYVYRVQLANNNKSVYIESGFTFDHVLFDHLIFGDHAAGSTAFDARANNWSLTNSHFETNHDDTATYDINAQGQNFRIQNNVMTQSGGVILNATNGIMSNNVLNRCTALIAIDSQAGENSINNNEIKWDTNTSAGRYDGTNKTGIKLTSANSCDGNSVKRSDIGIDNSVSNMDLVGNKINDAITAGIQYGSVTNLTITGGSIFVGKSGAAGILQTSGNGTGVFIDPAISFVVSGGAVKYSGLGNDVNGVDTITYGAGDNNDWAIEDYANTIRATANASGSAITGIASGYNNRKVTITNISANTLTIENEDTASTAANRILTGTGVAVSLAQNDTANLYYDAVSDRWRVSSVQS